MQRKKSFLERYGKFSDAMDDASRKAYVGRLSRERSDFEFALEMLDEGVIFIDRELRIRYFNRAAKALLGLTDDTAGLRVSKLLHSMDWARLVPGANGGFERVARQELELDYPAHRSVGVCLVPLEDDPESAVLVLQDRTELNRSRQDALNKGAGSALSLLASSVAHEIGNPLNNIYLNLQLLERSRPGASGELSEEERFEIVRTCRSEVERLEQIVTQFLSAMRPGHAAFAPVDLRDTVLSTLKLMKPEIENRRIAVNCDLPDDLPNVAGDAGQLKQAFYNILKNSLQATGSGGSIGIGAAADGEFVRLTFADNGCGIDGEGINRIFTPFSTSKTNGNGLGMFIIERICREHGAELSVDSRKGAGTAVTVKFRLRPPAPRAITQG